MGRAGCGACRLFTGQFLLVLLLTASLGFAADTGDWTLTTADLSRQTAILRGMDDHGLNVSTDAGPQQIPLDRFVSIQRQLAAAENPDAGHATTQPAEATRFILYLTTGDRIAGTPGGIENEQLTWTNPAVGALKIPLRQLAAMLKPTLAPADLHQPRTADIAHLANGDAVSGIVTNLAADQIALSVSGQETPIPASALTALYFASAGHVAVPVAKGFRIRLVDGSSFVAAAVTLAGNQLALTLPGSAGASSRTLDLAALSAIEQLNGPVTWLSSLTPVESVQIPQFSLTWPAQMDRTVTGQPIRFADTTYDRGIGVHAYSRLRFNIPPGYQSFRTQYAMDGAQPLADVTVRVLLDDQVVYEQKNVKAGRLAPPLSLPLNSAKTLSLEVEEGLNGDTQDRFNWIEPILLRATPATRPATQP
jgi:hypothetical protein